MPTLRNATEADIPVICKLAEQTWWSAYSEILSEEQLRYMLDTIFATETLKAVMKDGTQIFILLYDRYEPVGFASFGVRPEDDHIIKLHKLYVLPGRQGRGFGQLLLNEVKKRVREKGLCILDLNVNRLNQARIFYEKLGFRIIREEDTPIGPYWMNDYVMRLEIA